MVLSDPGPGGKLNADLVGRDDKADEAAGKFAEFTPRPGRYRLASSQWRGNNVRMADCGRKMTATVV